MKSENTISAALVIAALIQAGAIESLNYVPPAFPPDFSVAGSRFDLTNGDIFTPGLWVDGVTGNLGVLGDVTTTQLSIRRPGTLNIAARMLASGTLGAGTAELTMNTVTGGVAMGRLAWQLPAAPSVGFGQLVWFNPQTGSQSGMQWGGPNNVAGGIQTVGMYAQAQVGAGAARVELSGDETGATSTALLRAQNVDITGITDVDIVSAAQMDIQATAGVIVMQATPRIYAIGGNDVRPLVVRRGAGGAGVGGLISFEDSTGVELGYIGESNAAGMWVYQPNVGGVIGLTIRIDDTGPLTIAAQGGGTTVVVGNSAFAVTDTSGNGAGSMYAVQSAGAALGAPVVLTAAFQNGPSVALTSRRAGFAVIHGVFDFDQSVAGGSTVIGQCVFNGAGLTPQALYLTSATGRSTVTQVWVVAVAAGVANTFQLQGRKSVAAGTVTMQATHTDIVVTMFA